MSKKNKYGRSIVDCPEKSAPCHFSLFLTPQVFPNESNPLIIRFGSKYLFINKCKTDELKISNLTGINHCKYRNHQLKICLKKFQYKNSNIFISRVNHRQLLIQHSIIIFFFLLVLWASKTIQLFNYCYLP